jgi:FdrA protein
VSPETIRSVIKPSAYQDSVTLLLLARQLRSGSGVLEAAALLATPNNKDLLEQAGLLTAEADEAGPNDLVIAVRTESAAAADAALDQAERFLGAKQRRLEASGRAAPRTLESAKRLLPQANLALISVPGAFAALEAKKALRLGLHVMLFSDNVDVQDEIVLKRLAVKKGLLLMGPDCGTAILNGVPLGFANAVPRGRIGIVSASGTGLQQVTTLLAAQGEGISQAIGVGGRDLSEEVGGIMTFQAIDALGADPATELVVVIGKPPAPAVRARVETRLHALGKPCVLALLGQGVHEGRERTIHVVATLEDAALAALALLESQPFAPRPFSIPSMDLRQCVEDSRRALQPGQGSVCALYAGGTLAHEAILILEPLLGPIATNLTPGSVGRHRVVDLGADEYTIGRAHPMLDATVRVEEIRKAAQDPTVAVLLLDVVLGYGAAPDPAGDVAPAIAAALATARTAGRGLAVVVSVIGTAGDPQDIAVQCVRLEAAGAWVLPCNAQAVRAAACIAGGEPVLARLCEREP